VEALLDRHPLRVAMEARDLDRLVEVLAPDAITRLADVPASPLTMGKAWATRN
jgi:hypothetical protein